MTGYIIEFLIATGWRREGEIYWRLADARRVVRRRMRGSTLAARILTATIDPDAVEVLDADDQVTA